MAYKKHENLPKTVEHDFGIGFVLHAELDSSYKKGKNTFYELKLVIGNKYPVGTKLPERMIAETDREGFYMFSYDGGKLSVDDPYGVLYEYAYQEVFNNLLNLFDSNQERSDWFKSIMA